MTCTNSKALVNWSIIMTPLVIVFVVIGFATDYWVTSDVDRSQLSEIERTLSNSNQKIARFYHTRHRGILRECYPDNDATFLDEAPKVVNDNCFYIDFDDPETDMSSDLEQRMHFTRAVLALYVLGLVAVIINFFIGVALCFARNCNVAHAASVMAFVGGMFVLGAVVMFHASEYLEANRDGKTGELVFQNAWSANLLKATKSDFGYSYALAWTGLILAMFDGVLFLLAARALRLDEGGEGSDCSTSDRQGVIRKNGSHGSVSDHYYKGGDFYDNFSGKNSMPIYGGYPAFLQTIPAYPALTYGNSIYSTPDDEFRYEG